jgi:hypothetical protein
MKVMISTLSRLAAPSLTAVIIALLAGCAQASPQQDVNPMGQDNNSAVVAAGLPAIDLAAPKQVQTATFAVG